jgi:asparagine synthase (glutamine-hydrolysing)
LAFSSELTALLGQPGVEAVVDPDAVVEYFTYLYIPAPRTLLRGVWKLQPGESLTWRDGEVRRWFYWTIPPVDDDLPSPDQFRRTVRDGVRTAVERRLIADVPVGAFLSGGVDSGLIVALASQAQPGLNTFTAGFGEPDFDELEPARQVSRMFGTSHHEFVITPDAQLLLEEVISAMDEPIADSSAIPTFMIARETARHVKVVLSGVGGDELFFGYPRYLGFRLSQDMPSPLGRLSTLASRWFRSKPSGRDLGGWIRRFGEGVAMDPSERYHFWTTFLSAPAADRLLRFDNRLTAPALDAEGAGSSDLLDAVFRADLQRYMSSGLLKFADGMTMANSLEVRVPFCDVDLVEAMSRVPAAVRFPGFRLKSVLREMASECLPRSLARRPKQGFMIPIGRWLRNELNSYVQAELSDQNLPPFLAPDGVRSLVREHLSGRQNHTHLVWAALVLVRWLRLHPEVNAESAVSAFPVAR